MTTKITTITTVTMTIPPAWGDDNQDDNDGEGMDGYHDADETVPDMTTTTTMAPMTATVTTAS